MTIESAGPISKGLKFMKLAIMIQSRPSPLFLRVCLNTVYFIEIEKLLLKIL